ncbi:unnamed protein product [Brassica oleracea var. botrytis]
MANSLLLMPKHKSPIPNFSSPVLDLFSGITSFFFFGGGGGGTAKKNHSKAKRKADHNHKTHFLHSLTDSSHVWHDSFWLKLESGFSVIKSISVRRIW